MVQQTFTLVIRNHRTWGDFDFHSRGVFAWRSSEGPTWLYSFRLMLYKGIRKAELGSSEQNHTDGSAWGLIVFACRRFEESPSPTSQFQVREIRISWNGVSCLEQNSS